jgi:AbiU2
MSKKPLLRFQQILAWLMTEVMFSRAHFTITRGLGRSDRAAVLATAPRFFKMTLGAHADSAQLAASRIFDRTGDASIYRLLSSALKEAGTFKQGTATQVRKLVDESKAFVAALEPIVTAVRTRRNQTIAHADARPMVDPNRYKKAGRVSYRELEGLFEQTGVILNKFSLLYQGTSAVLDLADAKDYDQALDLIAIAIRTGQQSVRG